MPDEPVELGGDLRARDVRLRRLLLQDRVHRLDRRPALECPPARQHLVEDASEREDVRPRVGRLPSHLLGRHVTDGPEESPGVRGLRERRRLRVVALRDQPLLGEPEVEDLHAPVRRDEEVLGLEVPVDDPLLVRRREAAGHLHGPVEGLARRGTPRRQSLSQRLAFEELHDENGDAPADFFEGVDRRDVRVVQRGQQLRLTFEAGSSSPRLRRTPPAGPSARRRGRGACPSPCRPLPFPPRRSGRGLS